MVEDWWHRAVLYRVDLPTYADGDGDGIGDLAGLRGRFGHIARLGAHAALVADQDTALRRQAETRHVRLVESVPGPVVPLADAGWDAVAVRAAVEAAPPDPVWTLASPGAPRAAARYGSGESGRRRARAAAMVAFALPGAVLVEQGDELGLPGEPGVPLPWTAAGPSLGFSADDTRLPRPRQPADWAKLSVEAQEGDAASTLRLHRCAARLRARHPALREGGPVQWRPSPPEVLAFTRPALGESLTCTVNFGEDVVRLPDPGPLLMASSYYGLKYGELMLPPDTAVWWRDRPARR